jgi:hypothetical protein
MVTNISEAPAASIFRVKVSGAGMWLNYMESYPNIQVGRVEGLGQGE